MKVVILAGGLGTRMREETEFRPKPMVDLGGKPVLWHIMKIFAAQGFTDFVICAGYKGNVIREYFLNYSAFNSDFTVDLGDGATKIYQPHQESDWRVTIAETGRLTETGGRISRIRRYVGDEPFFCTYGDGIAPVNWNSLLWSHKQGGKKATLTTAEPPSRFGNVETDHNGLVRSFSEKGSTNSPVNIGYFIFEPSIFEYLSDDCILETTALPELAKDGELNSFKHDGFWLPMDTQRELSALENLWNDEAPWKIW